MTYPEAIRYLYDLRWFGAKLGLENTRQLAALAGHPEDRLRFIHVAGTNGKGSTCAMLESVYRAAGYRVGLFTSPHLVAFGERIQVNRHLISETDVIRLTAMMQRLLQDPVWNQAASPAHHPTFFEVVTILALCYFAEQQCDLVVWETGLGGRLDATNIVTPLASVITNVQFDHQQWLGNTLSQIAAEKAGIIKPHVPVLTAADEEDALQVISQTAQRCRSPLTVVTASESGRPPLDRLRLPLLGEHQRRNAALTLATIHVLQEKLPVSASAIEEGLSGVDWPGRFQIIRRPSGQVLLLDGAHNPAGAAMLRSAFESLYPDVRPTIILGILQDKDWAAICRILAPLGSRLLLTPVPSQRTSSPEELCDVCRQTNPVALLTVCDSLKHALDLSVQDPFLLVTGSLYLVGEAMEILRLGSLTTSNERELNEWQASQTAAKPGV